MPSSVAAEATAISATIRIRCFHSRSARRTAQRDSVRRAIAARRGSSGSRTGRSSRAYVIIGSAAQKLRRSGQRKSAAPPFPIGSNKLARAKLGFE